MALFFLISFLLYAEDSEDSKRIYYIEKYKELKSQGYFTTDLSSGLEFSDFGYGAVLQYRAKLNIYPVLLNPQIRFTGIGVSTYGDLDFHGLYGLNFSISLYSKPDYEILTWGYGFIKAQNEFRLIATTEILRANILLHGVCGYGCEKVIERKYGVFHRRTEQVCIGSVRSCDWNAKKVYDVHLSIGLIEAISILKFDEVDGKERASTDGFILILVSVGIGYGTYLF